MDRGSRTRFQNRHQCAYKEQEMQLIIRLNCKSKLQMTLECNTTTILLQKHQSSCESHLFLVRCFRVESAPFIDIIELNKGEMVTFSHRIPTSFTVTACSIFYNFDSSYTQYHYEQIGKMEAQYFIFLLNYRITIGFTYAEAHLTKYK